MMTKRECQIADDISILNSKRHAKVGKVNSRFFLKLMSIQKKGTQVSIHRIENQKTKIILYQNVQNVMGQHFIT